jgi:hypothetical protein
LDPDLAARIEGVRDLILTAASGSDGSGQLGARGGNAVTPVTKSHGGVAWGSPDFTVNGAPGVKSSGAWVYRDQRDTRDPLGALAGLGGARDCARGGGGGSARRRSPACGVPAVGTG